MAGLVPAIHILLPPQDVDARHKAGHDEFYDADNVAGAAALATFCQGGRGYLSKRPSRYTRIGIST
jgi:hypothetical protein